MVYILYTTDAWLSHASREVVGVFDSMDVAVKSALDLMKKNLSLYVDDREIDFDWFFLILHHGRQTQGLDKNFLIEEHTINTF